MISPSDPNLTADVEGVAVAWLGCAVVFARPEAWAVYGCRIIVVDVLVDGFVAAFGHAWLAAETVHLAVVVGAGLVGVMSRDIVAGSEIDGVVIWNCDMNPIAVCTINGNGNGGGDPGHERQGLCCLHLGGWGFWSKMKAVM